MAGVKNQIESMKRNYNTRIIKAKKSYSSKELAELLVVHIQTVRDWCRNGLKPIDEESHFALFLGSEVKSYLRKRMDERKVKLGPNDFYCMTCRNSTSSQNSKIVLQEKQIGKNKISIRYEGNCDRCGRKVVKFGSLPPNELATPKGTNTGPSPSL